MNVSKLQISLFMLAVAVVGLAHLTGCTTYGTVYVSHPQVFTRERLVAARQKELQFLNGALNSNVQSTYSGAEDARTLAAFQNSLAVTVSPTAGAGVSNASPSALSDATKLMPGGANAMDIAKNVSISPVDHFKDQMAYRDAVNAVIREKELDDTHDRDGKTLYTLKFDTALIPGDGSRRPALVKLTILDPPLPNVPKIYHLWLQDLEQRRSDEEKAIASRFYRGQVTAADEALLYYLKAGEDDLIASATNGLTNASRDLTLDFCQSAATLTADVLTLSQQCRAERLTQIMNYCAPAEASSAGTSMESASMSETAGTNTETVGRKGTERTNMPAVATATNVTARAAIKIAWNPKDLLLTGMTIALNAKYCSDFAGIASVQYNVDAIAKGNSLAFGHIVAYTKELDPTSSWWSRSEWKEKPQSGGQNQFSQVLSQWDQNAYVDSIDPQIYAQNISDVSSQAKLLELALTLNAAIAKPASLSESMKYIHQSQKFLQAIKRQPLALGFASGADFGWLLGPQFGIDEDGNATYSQAATPQSFSVSIVVPAWWKELNISATQCWINERGKEVHSKSLPPCPPVDLPLDMDALTSAIQSRSARLAPTLYLTGEALQAGTNGDQTLLIRGRELWRNPAVIVGSTPADTVDLLPDMRGLIAHFKTIPTTYSNAADLTVVTSFGADSLEKSIKILSSSKPATNNPAQAKLTNAFAVFTGQRLGFTLTGMPSAFAGFSTKIGTKDAPGKWKNLADSEYQLASNKASLTIPIVIDPPVPTAPTTYNLDLGFRAAPSDTPRSMFAGTNPVTFLFFPTKGQEQPVVASVTVNYTANAPSAPFITLGPAPGVTKALLYLAYPGLEKAVNDDGAKLVLSQKTTGNKSQALPIKDAAGTGWTVALSAAELPAGTYDAFTVQYLTSNGAAATIDCAAGSVTVTRQ